MSSSDPNTSIRYIIADAIVCRLIEKDYMEREEGNRYQYVA